MKKFDCTCNYCGKEFRDPIEDLGICVDCENEYAEVLDSLGLVVGDGWDEIGHPNYRWHLLPEKWKKGY